MITYLHNGSALAVDAVTRGSNKKLTLFANGPTLADSVLGIFLNASLLERSGVIYSLRDTLPLIVLDELNNLVAGGDSSDGYGN